MSVSVARIALILVFSFSFSSLTVAQNNEAMAFDWPQFLQASARRFEAQHERQLMSVAASPECEQANGAEHFAHCLHQDVFIRQSIESSGLSIEQYVRHWQALQQEPKRHRAHDSEYQRLRRQFSSSNLSAAP